MWYYSEVFVRNFSFITVLCDLTGVFHVILLVTYFYLLLLYYYTLLIITIVSLLYYIQGNIAAEILIFGSFKNVFLWLQILIGPFGQKIRRFSRTTLLTLIKLKTIHCLNQ